jgi:hypothetical protein
MARLARPRLERAVIKNTGTEAADTLTLVREALPKMVADMIENGSPQDRVALLRLAENELLSARHQQAGAILQQVKALREKGSPMLRNTWNQAVKDMQRTGFPLPYSTGVYTQEEEEANQVENWYKGGKKPRGG